MPFNLGAPELIIILVIALLVLGPGKLPEVGASVGKAIREFRKASSDIQESVKDRHVTAPRRRSSRARRPREVVAPPAGGPRVAPVAPTSDSTPGSQ